MRKLLLAFTTAATLLPVIAAMPAAAQSAAEIRQDNRDIRQEKREINRDVRRGDYESARENRQDLREARQERREDWRDYRRTHGDVFRAPGYRRPSGWVQRDWRPGYRLPPSYYGRPYWVDYNRYRLSPPPYGFRWVRVDRDVFLIRSRDGYIRDVIRTFFY